MARRTTKSNSAITRTPRRQASLDAYVGFRDTTHGTDVSNPPEPYAGKGARQPNWTPYRPTSTYGKVQ